MSEPSKARADLLSGTPKVITERIRWRDLGGGRLRLEAKVLAPELREQLKLLGNIGRTNFGFTLLYRNCYAIRRLNIHHRHTSPDGEVLINTLHKHTWDEVHKGAKCYVPDEIDQDRHVNDIFLAFLQEENIELTEPYQGVISEVRSAS